jgi:hypothetical protein
MKKSNFYWQLIACLLILSSCANNSPKEAAYIPKNATLVMGLDMNELQQKLKEGGMSSDSLISIIFGNDSTSLKMKKLVMEGKNESGINWDEKLFVFVNQQSLVDKSTATSVNVLGTTGNITQLEKYLVKQEEFKDKTIKREKAYSYLQGAGDLQVSWNKEVCIVTYYMHPTMPVYDTIEMTYKMPSPADIPKESKAETDIFFTQKTSQSLASVDVFNQMFREKADGFIFSSSNSALPMLKNLPFNPPKLEELLKNNYTTATLHFEKGKLRIQSNNHVNPALGNILNKYAGPVVNFALVKDYPSKDINLVSLVSFNPGIIGGILKHIELESFAESFLNKNGLSMDDLYKAFKGELAVVVSDLNFSSPDPMMKRDELSLERGLPIANVLMRIPVGDSKRYTKIMDLGVKSSILKKVGNQYQSGSGNSASSFFVLGDDKNLFIATNAALYNNYLASAGKPNSFFTQAPLNKYTASSTLFYVNIASTIHGFVTDSTKSSTNRLLYQIAGTCKELVVNSDNFDGKTVHGQAELIMQQANTNSLISMIRLLSAAAKEIRAENEDTFSDFSELPIPEQPKKDE